MLALNENVVVHVEFGNADCGCFANVGVAVAQAVTQRIDETVNDLFNLNVAHGTNGKRTNKWIWVFDILRTSGVSHVRITTGRYVYLYLDEGGDGHHGHVRLAASIVDQIKVDHFLNFEDRNVHYVENIGKQGRHVVAHGHVGNDFLHHRLFA